MQYAVLELSVHHGSESTIYAVPVCTIWLENIVTKICTKDGKEAMFATICKWPPDESKLSDYLEKKKKPTSNWIIYKDVKILKLCSMYKILRMCISMLCVLQFLLMTSLGFFLFFTKTCISTCTYTCHRLTEIDWLLLKSKRERGNMYNADIAYRIVLSFFLLRRNSEVETYRILFLLLLSKRKTSKKDIISTDYVYIVDVAMLSLMVG